MAEGEDSGGRMVNVKPLGGVPSFDRNLSRHQVSCLLVLQLLSYMSSARRRKRGKTSFSYIYFSHVIHEIFGILLSFHMFSAAKS